jgi:hypothetical protein
MNIWTCLLCGTPMPGNVLGQHFRLFHPDLDWQPENWLDGQPVVYDDIDAYDI